MQQEAIEVGKADEMKPAMMGIRTDTNQPTAQEAMDKYTIEKARPIGSFDATLEANTHVRRSHITLSALYGLADLTTSVHLTDLRRSLTSARARPGTALSAGTSEALLHTVR